MLRSILVPLDGSTVSEHALPYALALGRRTAASVKLVHVYTPGRADARGPAVDAAAEIEHARAYLAALGGALSERWEVVIAAEVLEGPVAETLSGYAAAHPTDLIVMTTHGRGPLSRMWLGSVADALVRQCQVPLLLTRPHEEPVDMLESVRDLPFQRILVALDGSELAECALEPALQLAEAMQAQLTLAQVIETPLINRGPAIKVEAIEDRVLAEWQGEVVDYLHATAERVAARVSQVTTRVLVGEASSTILDYARDHAIDLVALATHGRSGVQRMLLGSVADKLLRGAATPVLVTRARA